MCKEGYEYKILESPQEYSFPELPCNTGRKREKDFSHPPSKEESNLANLFFFLGSLSGFSNLFSSCAIDKSRKTCSLYEFSNSPVGECILPHFLVAKTS